MRHLFLSCVFLLAAGPAVPTACAQDSAGITTEAPATDVATAGARDARHPLWESVRGRLADGGVAAVLAGIGAMMVVAILPIPAEIPAAMNGMYFGPAVGILVTWLGAMLGPLISFELARRFGRPLLELASPRVRRGVDRAADALGARGLFVVRLIPIIAFTAINYAAGMAPVTRRTFLWTTGLGILPGTVAMTASGSGIAALYRGNATLAVVLTVGLLAGLLAWKLLRRPQAAMADPPSS